MGRDKDGRQMDTRVRKSIHSALERKYGYNICIYISIFLSISIYLSIYPERERMTQVVECLPSKLEAQNSNTCPTKIISKYTFVEKVAWLKCRTPA
jgi:hypothetical protein